MRPYSEKNLKEEEEDWPMKLHTNWIYTIEGGSLHSADNIWVVVTPSGDPVFATGRRDYAAAEAERLSGENKAVYGVKQIEVINV